MPNLAVARLALPTEAPKARRLERVKGIEPSSSAWKAVALPLSYTRENCRVDRRKFAPATGRTRLRDGLIVPQPDGRPCYRSRPGCASTLTEKQPFPLTLYANLM